MDIYFQSGSNIDSTMDEGPSDIADATADWQNMLTSETEGLEGDSIDHYMEDDENFVDFNAALFDNSTLFDILPSVWVSPATVVPATMEVNPEEPNKLEYPQDKTIKKRKAKIYPNMRDEDKGKFLHELNPDHYSHDLDFQQRIKDAIKNRGLRDRKNNKAAFFGHLSAAEFQLLLVHVKPKLEEAKAKVSEANSERKKEMEEEYTLIILSLAEAFLQKRRGK